MKKETPKKKKKKTTAEMARDWVKRKMKTTSINFKKELKFK